VSCSQNPPTYIDIRASEDEDNFAQARETVKAITLQHPITFDQYDICAMAKDGSLERLKLSILQSICQKLEIELPPKPFSVKKIYLDLLEKAVTNCTCHEPDDKNSKFLRQAIISVLTNELCAAVN